MSTHFKSPFKRSQRDYSMAFKLTVVNSVESGRFTYFQAQQHYGIQGRCTVLVWLRKHGTLNWNSTKRLSVSSESKKTPEQRIKELEASLEEERRKVLFLSTAMKIAEQQYGMQFKKKSSSKRQSGSKKKKN
jgi:transposase-like protein